MKKKSFKLNPNQLVADEKAFQMRAAMSETRASELAQGMREAGYRKDKPVIVFKKGKRWLVVDGFHRRAAALLAGLTEVWCQEFEGTEAEALQAGIAANRDHGWPLDPKEDFRRAARMLRAKKLSYNAIADTLWPVPKAKWLKRGGRRNDDHPKCHRVRYWLSDNVRKATQKRGVNRQETLNVGRTVQREGREAALQRLEEDTLKRFGAEALSLKYKPTVDWSLRHKAGSPGTPVLMISDVHYGEMVDPEQVWHSNEFNREICKMRLRHTFETAAGLLKTHFSRPDYEGIVLVLGGDLISGSIHEELAITDEAAPLVQCYEVAKVIADGVAFLAKEFKRVSVYCVAGNHGRTTRRPFTKFYAQNNLDWMAYKMIADYSKDLKNVEVWAPPSRDLNFTVAGHRYRLTHGDQFKGGDGIIGPIGPITRGDVRKRVTASLMPGQPEAYDTMVCGHFHTLMMLPRLIVNGSVKGFDEFALSINVSWEPPQQALWTVHPRHGHTWYMPVLCDPNYTAHGMPTEKK